MNPLWSWTITILGLASTWLLAHHKTAGWPVAITTNLTWTAYAIHTNQQAFIVSAVAYTALNIHGWQKWTTMPPTPSPGGLQAHRTADGGLAVTFAPHTILINNALITTIRDNGPTAHLRLTHPDTLEIWANETAETPLEKYHLDTLLPTDTWIATRTRK
jgi:hypothetical protein